MASLFAGVCDHAVAVALADLDVLALRPVRHGLAIAAAPSIAVLRDDRVTDEHPQPRVCGPMTTSTG